MTDVFDVAGHCLCGAVRYQAKAHPAHELHVCHCDMCRRWTGGPLMYFQIEGAPLIEGDEHVGRYRSSEKAERAFCMRCGSVLFWKVVGAEWYTVTAGSVDKGPALTFTQEIFVEEKPGYYDFANDTAKLTGESAMAAYVDSSERAE